MARTHLPAEEPEQPVRKYELPDDARAPAPADEGPSTSVGGKGGKVGKVGDLTLQGEQLQAFLRAAQAGQLPASLSGAAGAAPVIEEIEEGSDKPVHAKVGR